MVVDNLTDLYAEAKKQVKALILLLSFSAAIISLLLMVIYEDNPLYYDVFKSFMLLFAITFIFRLIEKVFLEQQFIFEMDKLEKKIAEKMLQPEQFEKKLKTIVLEVDEKIADGLDYNHHFQKYGLVNIHERIDFTQFFDEVEDGSEIKILDTYIPTQATFLPSLESALKRNINIKILYVKPKSDIANLRSEELGGAYAQPHFDNAVEVFRDQIARTAAKTELEQKIENIKLRFYEDLPCIPMYFIINKTKPKKLFYSFFLCTESVNYLHFEVLNTNSIFADFERYFDRKWKKNASNELNILNHIRKLKD